MVESEFKGTKIPTELIERQMKDSSSLFFGIYEGLKSKSQTLVDNSDAELVEGVEIANYLKQHSNAYIQFLRSLDETIPGSTARDKKISICIASSQEGKNIRRTLESFLEQPSACLERARIFILDNHHASEVPDSTGRQVVEFQDNHPEVDICYTHVVVEESMPFGSIRKLLFDLNLWRIAATQKYDDDHIIVSSDADLYDLSGNYLSSVLEGFDRKGSLPDVLVGSFTYPPESFSKYPLLAAAFYFHRYYRMLHNRDGNYIPWTSGRAMAFSAAAYCAVGGFNGGLKRASDIDFGRRIQAARKEHAQEKILRAPFWVSTDPRRVLSKMSLDDRGYSDEFEDQDWTRDGEVFGKTWQEYSIPYLETITKEGLEKEFSNVLVKKAQREGYTRALRNLSQDDITGIDRWVEENKELITEILTRLGIREFKFTPSRMVRVKGVFIPRILEIYDFMGMENALSMACNLYSNCQ